MASMSQLTMAMVTLYSGDPKRVQHFMKVYAFAKMIAEEEQIGSKQREIIEAAALVHDAIMPFMLKIMNTKLMMPKIPPQPVRADRKRPMPPIIAVEVENSRSLSRE